ncbi:MAG: hypothetical protein A2046_16455 [Bacteroidetes bacterium GWA2_30_7]|nr:MAG: hypothetical protein A2046_16455 [Bacteroidetes bacterium GWA2_30_7]
MKNIKLLILIFLQACSQMYSQKSENITVQKFKEYCDSGKGIILDVRTPGEYTKGHIEGATHINIADKAFENKINLMQKDKPIYVYCLSGGRSASASQILKKNGFKEVYNLDGGILSWQKAGFNLETSKEVVTSSTPELTSNELNKILKTNKLVLCDFNAAWCAPCKQMLPIIEKTETDFKSKINVQKIDIESSSELAKSYNVFSIPTFLLFKDGKKVWEKNGVISYVELTEIIKKNL